MSKNSESDTCDRWSMAVSRLIFTATIISIEHGQGILPVVSQEVSTQFYKYMLSRGVKGV